MTDILHFTNIDNLPTILADGGLWSDADCTKAGKALIRSGDSSIKARRMATPIQSGIGMGGFVGDYVPFYYAPRSPMLYSISCGNVAGVSSSQDPIIYLIATAEDFAAPTFVVTDGNAGAGFTDHFGSHKDIATKVDWPLMGARIWRNTDEDGDRKRRRAAEFLVHKFVPWLRIRAVVTRTDTTQASVVALFKANTVKRRPAVTVDSDWYF